MTSKASHIHKLKRLKYKTGNTIFFCALPDCSFKINIALALGKRSICWRCGADFIMSEYSLRLAKPHCDSCHKPKFEGTHIDTVVYDEMSSLPAELTLAKRLEKTIHEAQKEQEEEI